ncbi:hypothetical protein Acr_20g0008860 [Actinidia rufa]|uniref:4Fe-4S ferredoxin-type domain-containing protein n=1 Tax=Actinidia rufa TaxID=165716 RepID=A0A7J0GEE4_9ERIC|nr:hypothetical protein Acr_20g0008860 [Actinidia rufa]
MGNKMGFSDEKSSMRVDCIDCAANASVVSAVNEGIKAVRDVVPLRMPWVMVSVNDDEDLHFRKDEFDPNDCPLDCSRPCEIVCPADAISLEATPGVLKADCTFKELCTGLGDSVGCVKLIAVSLTHIGDSTISLMNKMYSIMKPNPACFNLWQVNSSTSLHALVGGVAYGGYARKVSTIFLRLWEVLPNAKPILSLNRLHESDWI